jgi:hypothetical protein
LCLDGPDEHVLAAALPRERRRLNKNPPGVAQADPDGEREQQQIGKINSAHVHVSRTDEVLRCDHQVVSGGGQTADSTPVNQYER